MIKAIVLLPRREDMDRKDFDRYFRETHLPLVVKMPGLRRLVVNWVMADPSAPPAEYDAVAEDWFDDTQAMEVAFASPEGKAVADDAPHFLDMGRFRLLVGQEGDIPLAAVQPTGR
jgi:uncharacterized protein (TIGR02118 family)